MPATMSFSSRSSDHMPTSQAATKPSAPMLIGTTVPTTNRATSPMMATHSGPMAATSFLHPHGWYPTAPGA